MLLNILFLYDLRDCYAFVLKIHVIINVDIASNNNIILKGNTVCLATSCYSGTLNVKKTGYIYEKPCIHKYAFMHCFSYI